MAKTDFQIENIKLEYVVTLCTSNKDKIAILQYSDLTFNEKHKDFNTLEFKIPYMLDGVIQIENKNFNLVKTTHLIFLQIKKGNIITHEEYFTLNVQKSVDGNGYSQTITCENLAFTTFNDKILRAYKNKGSQLLWDRNGSNGILNVLLSNLYNTWSVVYMDADLDSVYHEFEFDKSTYVDVIKQCEKYFNCRIVFDTVKNEISINPQLRVNYLPELGENCLWAHYITPNVSVIEDRSGNAHTGDVTDVTADVNGNPVFNNSTSVVNIRNSNTIIEPDNYTIEAYFNMTLGGDGHIIYHRDANNLGLSIKTVHYSGNEGNVYISNNNSSWGSRVTYNTWNHVVITKKTEGYSLYINGVVKWGGDGAGIGFTETYPYVNYQIGKDFGGSILYTGMYSEAWTDQQILDRYNTYFSSGYENFKSIATTTNLTSSINTNIMFTDQNFIKSLSINHDLSQLKTRIYIYGKNNLDISSYNPLGLYVENLDHYYNNGFSPALKTAWDIYQAKITSLTPTFTDLVTQLDLNTATLNTKKAELAILNTDLKAIQIHMDDEKKKSTSLVNTPLYDYYYGLQQDKIAEIALKQSEIDTINGDITTITNGMTDIRNQLIYVSNFTTGQLQELIKYIKEDTLEVPTVSSAKLLYQYAQHYLQYKSTLPITFSISSIDIFNQMDLQRLWDKIKCGNTFTIHCPELGYNMVEITLMSLTHNPISNSLSLEFSNTDELNNIDYKLQKLLVNMDRMSANVEINKDSYAKYELEKGDLLKASDGIDLSQTEIKAGDDNVITQRGFMGKDIGGLGALNLLADKLVCSTDNWMTYYTLLSSNGLHLITKDRNHQILIHPDYGFQIDKWVFDPVENKYKWDNIVYLDTNGEFTIDGGRIKLLTANHKNLIEIDPTVGFSLKKNTGTTETPVWVDILKLDSDGNIVLKNGEGQRIEIDSLGLSSKNTSNQLHGLSLKNRGIGSGYDQLGWYFNDNLQCFIAYDQEGSFEIGTVFNQYINILTGGWLNLMAKNLQIGEDATTTINMYGAVNCTNAKFSGLKNENNILYTTNDVFTNKFTGSFTDQAGVTHNVVNGLIVD